MDVRDSAKLTREDAEIQKGVSLTHHGNYVVGDAKSAIAMRQREKLRAAGDASEPALYFETPAFADVIRAPVKSARMRGGSR